MTMYFSANTGGFYPDEFIDLYKDAGTLPSDIVEITEEQYEVFQQVLSDGGTVIREGGKLVASKMTPDKSLGLILNERGWRNSELVRADIELHKVQDKDSKAVGSVSDWREYRKSLRGWPEHEDFPIKGARPKAPDAK